MPDILNRGVDLILHSRQDGRGTLGEQPADPGEGEDSPIHPSNFSHHHHPSWWSSRIIQISLDPIPGREEGERKLHCRHICLPVRISSGGWEGIPKIRLRSILLIPWMEPMKTREKKTHDPPRRRGWSAQNQGRKKWKMMVMWIFVFISFFDMKWGREGKENHGMMFFFPMTRLSSISAPSCSWLCLGLSGNYRFLSFAGKTKPTLQETGKRNLVSEIIIFGSISLFMEPEPKNNGHHLLSHNKQVVNSLLVCLFALSFFASIWKDNENFRWFLLLYWFWFIISASGGLREGWKMERKERCPQDKRSTFSIPFRKKKHESMIPGIEECTNYGTEGRWKYEDNLEGKKKWKWKWDESRTKIV